MSAFSVWTWNVNSIRARYDRVLNWIENNEPDVLCLQELKCQDGDFPYDEMSSLGYEACVYGQKAYNGVAILSQEEPEEIRMGMDDGSNDTQARLVSARVGDIRVISAYVPNGGQVGSDKWVYKLSWYQRLLQWLETEFDPKDRLVLCGDFNVAPETLDVARPGEWEGGVLCAQEVRDALSGVVEWGLSDTFRQHEAGPGHYSWWDYRRGGFRAGNGLRIDMVYATSSLAKRCTAAQIDVEERREHEGDTPSDHAPVGAIFDL